MEKSYKLGFWAAVTVVVIGLVYVVVLIAGITQAGVDTPITDPILAVMEGLTILSALAILIAVAAVYQLAPADHKLFGLIALIFISLFTGMTSTVHFLELTISRQTGTAEIVWPSQSYAAELLAWDGFLGLALIFLSFVFTSNRSDNVIFYSFLISGILTLSGIIGPLTGNMQLQRIGIVGYAIVLPIAFYFLARMFQREMGILRPNNMVKRKVR